MTIGSTTARGKSVNLANVEFTENGVYVPSENVNGFAKVTVNVNEGPQINNQDKTASSDGVYTADQGYTGLGTVTVTAGANMSSNIEARLYEINSGTGEDESGDEDPPL